MKYKNELFVGKNGKEYILRSPEKEDAGALLDYLKATTYETEHGVSYAEEIDFTLEQEEDFIALHNEDPKSIMISAFDGDKLIGNASLDRVLNKQKIRHRATFGIAILKSDWGQGLGKKMVSELISFARNAGYEQLELEVVASNVPAIALYEKLGFVIYGKRPRSFKLKSGEYFDELLMMLKLN